MNKILTLTFLLLSMTLMAQNHEFCGTKDGPSEWLKAYQKNPDVFAKRSNEKLWIPIQMHLVHSDQGHSFYSESDALNAFCRLKDEMIETNIELYLAGDVNIICDGDLYLHSNFSEGKEIMDKIDVDFPNVINVYFTENAAGYCGYAYYWLDRVVVKNDCAGQGDYTFVHEIGHIFSMPHTFGSAPFEIDYNQNAPDYFEKVDRSNCREAGDGFCDTPPDYLNYRWNSSADCMSGIEQLDPNGEAFRSDAYYYMSYGDDKCAGGFSPGQIDAMRAYILSQRSYLLNEDSPFKEITATEMGETMPSMGGIINTNEPTLSWEPIENASHYIVQISTNEGFFSIIMNERTSNTSIDVNLRLYPSLDYYWRVLAYNNGYPCPVAFPINHFKAEGSAIQPDETTTNSLTDFQITPNPFFNNDGAQIFITTTKVQNVDINMYNAVGQHVFRSKERLGVTCINEFNFDFSNFTAGVYYVIVESEDEKLMKTIVVQ